MSTGLECVQLVCASCAGECEWVELWVCQRPLHSCGAGTFSVCTRVLHVQACMRELGVFICAYIELGRLNARVCPLCTCVLYVSMCVCSHACRSVQAKRL